MVIDPEDDREGDGERTSLTGLVYKSTRQSGHGGQAQMASCYAHRQTSWRTALDDDDGSPQGMKDYDNRKKTRKKICRPIVSRMDAVVFGMLHRAVRE